VIAHKKQNDTQTFAIINLKVEKMTTLTIYGIKNCDTMKKAFKWLEAHNIAYEFHDYKKQGIDENALSQAIERYGWDSVINKRGTTWRKLPDNVKSTMDQQSALIHAAENPSLIKRPLLIQGQSILLGFDETVYANTLQ
tara:strand:+ start:20376 stop:20792 length:417 start_codon:yes stop_codon:yes gene_type:complete